MRVIRTGAAVTAALTLAVTAAACSSSGGSGSGGSGTQAAGTPQKGGTVTMQWVGGYPNFIFPLMPATNTDGYNGNLQTPMWPDLVYAGDKGQSTVNPDESLYSNMSWTNGDQTVTITLKPWKWSDGTPITSRDFTFSYNMIKSMGQNWSGYLPGLFPDDVKSVQTPDAQTIVINLTRSYNPTFYTDNVLYAIPLLPQHAWDKESTAGAVGNYDQTTAGAKAVVSFLQKQGSQISTFTTNPLWKVVDGPWKLGEFTSGGTYAFVPNKNYSGTVKPHIAEMIDEAYTTSDAAWNALRAGDVTIGGIPGNDISQISYLKSQGYTIQDMTTPAVAGIYPNWYAPNGIGALLQQLYVRQAMEDLINRPQIVQQIYHGYADPGNGPVSLNYKTLTTPLEKSGGPYPYSPSKAVAVLKANGWQVNPGGVSTCKNPGSGSGQCGAGIAAGAKLAFTMEYSAGDPDTDQMEAAIQTWEEQAGIKFTLKSEPFNTLVGTIGLCNAQSHPASTCAWQLVDFGYEPYGLYPAGAGIFDSDSSGNQGGYTSPQMDSLIHQTEYTDSPSAFSQYEDYAAQQLPQLYLPDPDELFAYKSSLAGVQPSNPFSADNDPENWYFTKG
ncbi:MAG TPA: ABC transporter substrate-binding protein [Streptosporangiaceae bacterium]|jgi:peptide/nickel transport system substrate-binding protein